MSDIGFAIPDRTVYDGRPADLTGRAENEVRVYDLLDRLGVCYQRLDHTPAPTIEECGERGEVLGVSISKNLFLCNTQKTRFYLLMMPGGKRFQTKVFSHQIGSSRLSFAPPDHMERLLGTLPGSASVLGLMNDTEHEVRLYIDADVLAQEYVGCHPCRNTSTLKLRTEDLLHTVLPAIGHTATTVYQPW